MCSVHGVVQNKATEFHSLQRGAPVGDQTSTASSFQVLCSRSSLTVMRVILSHPFNNFNCCTLGDVVGTEALIFQAGWPTVVAVVLLLESWALGTV